MSDSTHPVIDTLKKHSRRKFALLTGRASAGIEAALRVWGVEGKPVAIPANTCYAVLWAVLRAGGIPLLTDIDPANGAMTPAALDALPEKPAVIIPCHMYGIPAPIRALTKWAKAHGVALIEDAALTPVTHHSSDEDSVAGTWGECSVFSFGAGKIIDNGVGGALLTNDENFARECARVLETMPLLDDARLVRINQWAQVYWALHQFEDATPDLAALYPALFALYGDLIAYRLPPDDWSAFPLDMPTKLIHREYYARIYNTLFQDAAALMLEARTIDRAPGTILWRYPLFVAAHHRDALLAHLWEDGHHEVTRWYPLLQPMARALMPDREFPDTPNAARWCAEIINLPLYPQLRTTDEAKAIAQSLLTFAQQSASEMAG